ncbi:MAG: primosomal protein N', partial [Terriglobales bacterium]
MPLFCDVALAVPLDMVFTYAIPLGMEPVVGGRVLVPFRQQRMSGIVVELHDRPPQVNASQIKIKKVIEALDLSPVLDEHLLKLGKWIADYYLAPVGEVFRTMLPLSAEFKRSIAYRITDEGRMALHLAGMSGSPARSKRTPEQQLVEFRVLDYLAERESVREESLRGTTRVGRALLAGMVQKRWIAREDVSAARDAARLVKVAVLIGAEAAPPETGQAPSLQRGATSSLDGRDARRSTNTAKKLNENQRTLIETLAASGGRVPVEALRGLDVPRTTLGTLVRRGLIELVDEAQDFTASGVKLSKLKPRPSPFEFEFSAAQKEALAKIGAAVASRKFGGLLLHGITGSGKTAVYLACMREVLEQGRSSILLVPEIGLTPAVAADLQQVFGDEVAILHSGLSDAERAEQWHRIRRGEARVVAGTRSAVFAPVSDLALVIVDEEQDSSYKQEETPRYHARDVAVMRAKMAGAVVVLGSATPSLESYYNAKKNKYALMELPDRVEMRPLPEVEIVDMRQEFQETGQEQVISRKLAEEIRERLEKKEQVMVLLNRRGYSPVVLCRACGKTLQCENCAVSMTHHKRERKMECHYCGHVEHIPDKCAHCGSEYVYFVGTGSEKLEELLHGMFPQARIGRLDRDTVRGREDFERALNALNEGALDMLVGTQMIAK